MHLDSLDRLPAILKKTHFLILLTEVELSKTDISFSGLIPIPPNEKNTYDIETIRGIEAIARMKHTTPATILLEQAQLLTLPAENAFLKLLEEPNSNLSFIFVAPPATTFLPTVLSRAKVFRYKVSHQPTSPPTETELVQARTLVSGSQRELLPLANTLSKDREKAKAVTRTAIRELYSSQLKYPQPALLARLEKLLALESALDQNGHVKLHIANMVQ